MILNIIHVITTIELGGAEKQLLILVRNQRKFGHSVTIFYLKGKPELRDAFEKLGVKVLSGDAGFIRSTFILAKHLEINSTSLMPIYLVLRLYWPWQEFFQEKQVF